MADTVALVLKNWRSGLGLDHHSRPRPQQSNTNANTGGNVIQTESNAEIDHSSNRAQVKKSRVIVG